MAKGSSGVGGAGRCVPKTPHGVSAVMSSAHQSKQTVRSGGQHSTTGGNRKRSQVGYNAPKAKMY